MNEHPDDVVGEFVSAVYGYVDGRIASEAADTGDWLRDLIAGLERSIHSVVNGIRDWLHNVMASLRTALADAYDDMARSLTATVTRVSTWIDALTSAVADWLDTAYQRVGVWLATAMTTAGDLVSMAVDRVGGWLREAYTDVTNALATVTDRVGGWLRDAYADVGGWIAGVLERVQRIVADLLDQLRGAWEAVRDALVSFPDWLQAHLLDPVAGFVTNELTLGIDAAASVGALFAGMLAGNPGVPEPVRQLLTESRYFGPLLNAIIIISIFPNFLSSMLAQVHQAAYDRVGQGSQAVLRPALLPVDALVTAMHRRLVDPGVFADEMARHGFTDADQSTLLGLYRRVIAPADAIALWRRGLLDSAGLTTALTAHGLVGEQAALTVRATEQLPNVQDMVRFAVREVYNPETVARLGLFGEFPDDFAAEAAKVGLSREHALHYWGAHWELPSPQMVFEMMHRGRITHSDVQAYLRAADYSPAWREHLTAIAYNPLTRVDVRRMYAEGLVERDAVYRNYLDLGYHPDHAELLTKYADALREGDVKELKATDRDLTRAQVERAYRDRLITEDTAQTMLLDMGYDNYEGAFITALVDWDRAIDRRERQVSNIRKRYLAGELDLSQVERELTMLALPAGEIEDVVTDLRVASIREPRTPSLSDLRTFLRHRLLTRDEFVVETMRLGYSERWATLYAQLPTRAPTTA